MNVENQRITAFKREITILNTKVKEQERKVRDTSRELERWIKRAHEAEAKLHSLGVTE